MSAACPASIAHTLAMPQLLQSVLQLMANLREQAWHSAAACSWLRRLPAACQRWWAPCELPIVWRRAAPGQASSCVHLTVPGDPIHCLADVLTGVGSGDHAGPASTESAHPTPGAALREPMQLASPSTKCQCTAVAHAQSALQADARWLCTRQLCRLPCTCQAQPSSLLQWPAARQ